MAATVGTLRAILTLSPKSFNKGLNSAADKIGKFGSTLGTGVASVAKYGTAAVAAGVGLATYFTKQQMDAIDTTAKAADRLGTTTEALVGLQFAGDLAGISAEQLNGALTKMERTLGTAATQGGPAAKQLDALGLSANALINLAPEQSFGLISDRINSLGTASEKTAAAMAIFGRSGAELLPLINAGSTAISAQMQEAQLLGMTYSRVDAAKVEAANDAITRMGGALSGIFTQLAIQISPYLEYGVNLFLEWAKSGGGMGEKIGKVLGFVGTVLSSYVIPAVQVFGEIFLMVFGGANKVVGYVIQGIGWLLDQINKAAEAVKYLSKGTIDLTFSTKGVKDFGQEFHDYGDSILKMSDDLSKRSLGGEFQNWAADISKAADAAAKASVTPKPAATPGLADSVLTKAKGVQLKNAEYTVFGKIGSDTGPDMQMQMATSLQSIDEQLKHGVSLRAA